MLQEEMTAEQLCRSELKNKRRIVIKIGSSSLIHSETGGIDYIRLEKLVRIMSDLKNRGKDVVLVSSGAIGVGYKNHKAAQVLLTFDVIISDERRKNARNTLNELLRIGIIPVVNENDTVATEEIEFGDNDTLSAIVATLIGADLLILLTDIDGLYTDEPKSNPDAKRLSVVTKIDNKLIGMAKGSGSSFGTGGMATKIAAARIATDTNTDMVICDSEDLDNINKVIEGEDVGTLFIAHEQEDFDTADFIKNKKYMEM